MEGLLKKKNKKKKEVIIKLIMTEDKAKILCTALETMARIGMHQLKDLFSILLPRMDYEESDKLEKYIKDYFRLRLSSDVNCGITNPKVPVEFQVCWDAYQHLRRELSWHNVGKDWRKDERDWKTMMSVSYDDPFPVTDDCGYFKTEIEEKT